MVQSTQPPADPFSPLASSAEQPFDHPRLCHLMRRATLGISPDRLRSFASQSPSQIIDGLMTYDPSDDRPYAEMLRGLRGSLSVIHSPDEAQRWWLYRMLDTPRL